MSKQTRNTLKSFFQTGDVPTEGQYVDLIDSNLNLSENNTGDIQLTGNITASGNISASGTIVASKIKSLGSEVVLENGHVSASGTVSGSTFISTNGRFDSIILGTGANRILKSTSAGTGNYNFQDGGIFANGQITASGEISASRIISSKLMDSVGANNITFGEANNIITLNPSGSEVMRIDGDNARIGINNTSPTEALTVQGSVSASGRFIGISLNTGQGHNELYAMNQNVTSGSIVTFTGVTLTKTANSAANFNSTITTEGQNFTVTINNIPLLTGLNDIGNLVTARTTSKQINNSSCTSKSVVLISSTSELSAVAHSITDGRFDIVISNESTSAFTGGTATFNVAIL